MDNTARTTPSSLDLQALLHPCSAFAHPLDVVRDPELTLSEKRSILASWAADACAIDAAPMLQGAAAGHAVRYDEIIDALQSLDAVCHPADATHAYKRRQRRRRIADWLGRNRRDSGADGLGSGVFG